MNCLNCDQKSVIVLQHGALCKIHFINYFEDKVFKTISKYNLIDKNDKLCVAASGGKDSLTVLYLTKKYLDFRNIPMDTLFALAIDEGIEHYRAKTLVDLRKFCEEHTITLHVVEAKQEFNYTLDEAFPIINKGTKKKPCNICGVWRRYLLNRYARKYGATKVITGHNLDDEAQAIMMNMFKANTDLAAHLGPITGIQHHPLFAQRVKPLYFCTEKETRLYALLKEFQVEFTECPYSNQGLRSYIQTMLNDAEQNYKGIKQGIINSFLAILPTLKQQATETTDDIKSCTQCQEPAHQDICNACKIKNSLAQV